MKKAKLVLLILSCSLIYGGQLFAQGVGKVSGVVKDADGGFLPGATVYIQKLETGALTDRYGKFELFNVPEGNYELTVSFIGFNTQTVNVSVTSGGTANVNVTLTSSNIMLNEIMVTSVRKGQVKALNAQRNAENIINVISREEINKYPDVTAADAMKRMPGVNVRLSYGEGRSASIRGTNPALSSVTVNGQKIASPIDGGRYVGIDVINSSQLEMIEVFKTLTPDMESDAIGGSLNLVTKTAFDHEGTYLSVKAASGVNTFGGTPFNSEFTYSSLFGKNKMAGITMGGSWNRNNIIGQQDEFYYGESDLPDGTTMPYALQEFYLMHSKNPRTRYGFNAAFDFKINRNHTFFINGMYNRMVDDLWRNTVRYRPGNGDYLTPTSVNQARMAFEYSARTQVESISQIAAGGHSNFNGLKMDYAVSYSYAEEFKDKQFKSEWQLDEKVNFSIDNSDVDFPVFNITNLDEDYSYDAAHWKIDKQDWRATEIVNKNLAASLDFKKDFTLGSGNGVLKFGGKYRNESKTRNNERLKYKWQGGDVTMADVSVGDHVTDFLKGHYTLSPMLDYDKYEAFFEANRDKDNGLQGNPVYDDTDGIGGQYDASEAVTAGYIMATVTWGKFKAMAGVRDEYTKTTYEGVELKYDVASGDMTGYERVSLDNNYNHISPHLHLQYNFSSLTDLRFAVTTGIARPEYFQLAPYFWLSDRVIQQGNPDLKPTKSTNFDLMFGHYFKGIGALNIGLFAKELKDIMYKNANLITGGVYDGYINEQTVNGENASLYGVELSWMQQFTFLPGFASGFGIYANYTYTHSSTEIKRMDVDENIRDIKTLPGQLGNVGNVGLNYEKYGFNARLSLYYAQGYLYDVMETEELDRYYDDYAQLDFTCNYAFNKHLELFVNCNNLTNAVTKEYFQITDRPRVNQFVGTSFIGGVRFTL